MSPLRRDRDTAQHTLEECPARHQERHLLISHVGRDLSSAAMIPEPANIKPHRPALCAWQRVALQGSQSQALAAAATRALSITQDAGGAPLRADSTAQLSSLANWSEKCRVCGAGGAARHARGAIVSRTAQHCSRHWCSRASGQMTSRDTETKHPMTKEYGNRYKRPPAVDALRLTWTRIMILIYTQNNLVCSR
ncbi:jg25922 [Pararge aegeria aegeria]|uniref:Jg25922 protein n=1 Tax=Pararge aegeria aegeria TaxID=348720 RepID=A0A8S4QSI8_9NEOP|nr:jg25922 [Pararge aegeria aegeria]